MNTAFDDVRLPVDIETGAALGPSFQTTIVPLSSGAEQRNADWLQERFVADISYGIMAKKDPYDQANSFAEVLRFYRARMGRWRGFRFRDWSDFEGVDVPVKMLTANHARLQILYDDYYVRNITKPTLDTLHFTGLVGDQSWQLLAGGVILFNGAQPLDAEIVANFEFDVPVRFDADLAQVTLTHLNAGQVDGIKLIQVPDPVDPAILELIDHA